MFVNNPELHGEAFNFGPRAEQNRSVLGLIEDLSGQWGEIGTDQAYKVTNNIPFNEAGLLKLNCDKSLFHLGWRPNLDYAETINMVGDWYTAFYRQQADMYALTIEQISAYERLGVDRNHPWAIS